MLKNFWKKKPIKITTLYIYCAKIIMYNCYDNDKNTKYIVYDDDDFE